MSDEPTVGSYTSPPCWSGPRVAGTEAFLTGVQFGATGTRGASGAALR
jgi:hypothetical protein